MPALLTRMSSPPRRSTVARDRGLPGRLVGDVEVRRLAADPLSGLGGVLQVADHHLRAGLGKRLGHPGTEPLGTTGDQRIPACEHVLSHPSLL